MSDTITDGYHTMDELYEHRTILFSIIYNTLGNLRAWKTKEHHPMDDTPMYEGYFLAGIHTDEGDYSYHCEMKYWDLFHGVTLEHAPVFDGHKPSDITRLFSLYENGGK